VRRRGGQDGFALRVRSGTIRVGLALLLAQILDSGRRVRKQQFSAMLPNPVWLADITSLPTGEGWLYLAAVLDLATRKIVGWSMRDHMRTEPT
jgi:transposase InsO family protein